jgi:hypothetical protein
MEQSRRTVQWGDVMGGLERPGGIVRAGFSQTAETDIDIEVAGIDRPGRLLGAES